MLVVALDLATVTGIAIGRTGAGPRAYSLRLRRPKEDADAACRGLARHLHETFSRTPPDLVVVEDFLDPRGHRSNDAAVHQLMLHGALAAVCEPFGLRLRRVRRAAVLKHFLGPGRPTERAAIKAAVVRRAQQLRWLGPNQRDEDAADALATWDYATATERARALTGDAA